jgi:hypothetical protein
LEKKSNGDDWQEWKKLFLAKIAIKRLTYLLANLQLKVRKSEIEENEEKEEKEEEILKKDLYSESEDEKSENLEEDDQSANESKKAVKRRASMQI